MRRTLLQFTWRIEAHDDRLFAATACRGWHLLLIVRDEQRTGRWRQPGGIAGADAHCQKLAAAVGSTRTSPAYLSAPGTQPIHARDRIGHGPWFNAAGVQVAANLEGLPHDDQTLSRETLLTEEGRKVPGATHDMLTGSTTDGQSVPGPRDATCQFWTSNGTGGARVGHHDRATSVEGSRSWNSAHTTNGCSAKA